MKISEILDFLSAEKIAFTFEGNRETTVEGFSSLQHYKPNSFTWIKTGKNIPESLDLSQITLAIVSDGVDTGTIPNTIRTTNSKRAFFSSIEHFYGQAEEQPAVGQFTYLSPKVKLGKNVRIGHNCTLDGDITIGDGTVIWNNVVIVNRVTIGRDCDIHSGAVIGHDGYAYTEDALHKKTMIKHFGGVSIGDRVLIGENVCISRGTIDDTILESGVKIDALGHIAHNCWFEEDAAMAVPCSVSGSVHIGRNGYLAGTIIRNQCVIGENAFIGMGAVVVKDVPSGETVVGNPAKPFIGKKE
nr:DapH/DapD/GlmU-related protein [uncultured Oscillibacter sp.]